MKKVLNIGGITNELEGASLFFSKSATSLPANEAKMTESALPESPAPEQMQGRVKEVKSKRDNKPLATPQPKSEAKIVIKESMQASNNASMHASNQPLIHDTVPDTIIETIRKAVKYVGKDSATYRFTPEEKKALLELGFSYKMQGYKTSENELTRIAINFLLEDHRENGKNSILQRVLDALRE